MIRYDTKGIRYDSLTISPFFYSTFGFTDLRITIVSECYFTYPNYWFRLLLVLYLTGIAAISKAQTPKSTTLFGTVTHAVTGEKLPNATVFVMDIRKGAQTDKGGFYILSVPSARYTVKFSSIGFKPVLKEIDLNTSQVNLDIQLEEDTKLLDEVTITTGKPEENVQKVEIGASRLNIRSIQKIPAFMGEVDVMRSLLMLPGVTTVGEGTTGINVRGGSIDQNLVLMDEAPLFNTSHLFGFFSVFNQDAVRDVTLQRGGIPAEYGGRASSVLDVRLKYPNSEQFSGSGGIGLISSRLTLEGPIVAKKLSTLLAMRASFNDFLFKIGPIALRDTRANFYDITNKWLWTINPRQELTFTGYFSNDNFKIPSDSLSSVDVNASSSLFGYRTASGTLRWQFNVNEKVSWEAAAVLSNYRASTMIPDSANALDLVSSITYQNLKFQYSNRTNARHFLKAGGGVIGYGLQPNTLTPGPYSNILPLDIERERAAEFSAFAEDEWKLTRNFSAVIGLRYSQFLRLGAATINRYVAQRPAGRGCHNRNENLRKRRGRAILRWLEPRAWRCAGRWGPIPRSKPGYNRMRQYLQLMSNTTAALPTARWTTSSPYIKPQIADQLSLGLFKNLKNDMYETSAEVYYKKIQNALDYKDGADIVLNQSSGNGRAAGRWPGVRAGTDGQEEYRILDGLGELYLRPYFFANQQPVLRRARQQRTAGTRPTSTVRTP